MSTVAHNSVDGWVSPITAMSDETNECLKRLQTEDLHFLVEQLTWKDGYQEVLAQRIVEEYRKWLAIRIAATDPVFQSAYLHEFDRSPAMPSKHIDSAWHRHILFTHEYAQFCKRVAGRMLHHRPCTKANVCSMDTRPTFTAYEHLFGLVPDIWRESEDFLAGEDHGICEGGGCD